MRIVLVCNWNGDRKTTHPITVSPDDEGQRVALVLIIFPPFGFRWLQQHHHRYTHLIQTVAASKSV